MLLTELRGDQAWLGNPAIALNSKRWLQILRDREREKRGA